MKAVDILDGLPGHDLIRQGLSDVKQGRRSKPACLVAIAWPRLRRAGLIHSDLSWPRRDAELELYRMLRQEGGDAYSAYNALMRRLISFESALDHRQRREEKSDGSVGSNL
jgi:hypothetical protein